jgi:protein-disulfide isomerase-like protein with CxxC motif
LIIFVILFFGFLRKSYLYTRGANVVITDDHYVQGGKILDKEDKKSISERFSLYEKVFHEKFLEASKLAEKKQLEKKALFENLKDIAMG